METPKNSPELANLIESYIFQRGIQISHIRDTALVGEMKPNPYKEVADAFAESLRRISRLFDDNSWFECKAADLENLFRNY